MIKIGFGKPKKKKKVWKTSTKFCETDYIQIYNGKESLLKLRYEQLHYLV